jgi:SGNH domain (fused to AT3 domains)
VFVGAGVLMTASLAVGVVIEKRSEQAAVQAGNSPPENSTRCDGIRPQHDRDLCALGAGGQPTFLVWGDSHAGAFGPGIGLTAEKHGVGGQLAFKSGCPPLLDTDVRWKTSDQEECAAYNDAVLRYIAQRPNLGTVILAARWAVFADGRRYKSEDGDPVVLAPRWSRDDNELGNTVLFDLGLQRTVATLRELERRVVLVGPVPEVGYEVPEALFVADRTGRDVNDIIAPSRREFEERNRAVMDSLSRFRGADGVSVVDISDWMCGANRCEVADLGQALYRDSHHLSLHGSERLAPMFESVLATAASAPITGGRDANE